MFNKSGKFIFALAIIFYLLSVDFVFNQLAIIHPYIDSVSLKILAGICLAIALFGKIIGFFLIFIAFGNLLAFFWMGASDFYKVQQSIFLFITGCIALFAGSDVMNGMIRNDHKRDKTCRSCKGNGGEMNNAGKYILCSRCGGTGRVQ